MFPAAPITSSTLAPGKGGYIGMCKRSTLLSAAYECYTDVLAEVRYSFHSMLGSFITVSCSASSMFVCALASLHLDSAVPKLPSCCRRISSLPFAFSKSSEIKMKVLYDLFLNGAESRTLAVLPHSSGIAGSISCRRHTLQVA